MIRILKFVLKFLPWGVMLFLSPYVWLPTSYWLQFDYVRVADTRPGIAPALTVSRTIYRPITASWAVIIRKVETRAGKAGFVTACTATGKSDYITTAIFPEKLNLDWWTWPVHCSLEEGQYVMTTIWTLNILGFWPRDIVVASNVFTVKAQVDD